MHCPVCEQAHTVARRRVHDDRYGYPGEYSLFECLGCGHTSLAGTFSPEALGDLYSNFYPRSSLQLEDFRPYEEVSGFGAWCEGEMSSPFRWVPRNVRVLDIGCGFGETLGYHEARGCEAYGVEADENIRRVADRFGYKVRVGLFDAAEFEPNYFDFVTMGQVIEHVADPMAVLRGVERVLKPGGVAVLSTPNAGGWGARLFRARWAHWHAPYHLQFFTVRSMKLAAERAGLVLERSKTITPSAWLRFQWIHLATRPTPGQASPFWSGKGSLTLLQRAAIRLVSIADQLKLNQLLTRLMDALRLGDNRLYFLRKP